MPPLPFRRRPLVEELEPRLLYSVDLAPLALDGAPPAPEQRVVAESGEFSGIAVQSPRNELVIVDTGVENYQALLDDILKQGGGDRRIEIVLLDANRDGVEQISEALAQRGNLDALHLISHGGPGLLQIGDSRLDTASIEDRSAEIGAWYGAFREHADLLIYGCNVAEGTAGETFINTLSQLTGTDVAGSTDLTGSATLGGDWNLEYASGRIETGVALSAAAQTSFQTSLAATSETLVNNATTNPEETSAENRGSTRAIATTPAGGSFVVWTATNGDASGAGVFGQIFDSNGAKIGGTIAINEEKGGDQKWASVASAGNGNLIVTWSSENQDGSGYGVYARVFDARGTALTDDIAVNKRTSGDQWNSSVSADANGNFVVAWVDPQGGGKGIHVRRFDAVGNALDTNDIQVASAGSRKLDNPAVAMNASGAFVVTWDDDGDNIYAQRYDNTGAAQGGTITVQFAFQSKHSAVAMADDGSFVVAGTSSIFNQGIYARRYDASGDAIGNFAVVNTTVAGNQISPSIAMDGSGNYAIVWEGQGTGDTAGVFARVYSSAGTALTGELRVNETTSGVQHMASVALRDIDHIVVAWSGEGAGDTNGVFVRQLAALSANAAPTISAIANQTVQEDGTTGALAFTVDDADTAAASLVVTASSSDQTLIPDANIVLGGSGANRAITVTPAPDLFGGPVTITVTVSDGVNQSQTSFLVTVSPQNDAPTIANLAGDGLAYHPGSGPLVVEQGGDVHVADIDSADFNGGRLIVSIAGGGDPGEDVLDIRDEGAGVGKITVSGTSVQYDFGGGPLAIGNFSGGASGNDLIIDLTGNATPEAVAALIRNITYENTDTVAPTAGARTIRYTLYDGDGGGTSIAYDATVTVFPSNAPPVITGLNGDKLNYREGDGASVIEQGADAKVSDTDSVDLDGGNLTVSIVANGVAGEDRLSIRDEGMGAGQIGFDGVNVYYGGTTIGTATGSSGGSNLVVAFNANATQAAVTALVLNITYENTESANPDASTRAVRFTVSDGDGGTSSTHDASVRVTPVSDAPVAAVNTGLTLSEGATATIDATNLAYSDVDNTAAQLVYTIAAAPANGTLRLNTTVLGIGSTFTQDDLDNGRLSYQHNGGETASDGFSFTLSDGTNVVGQTAFSITVNPVNDAPTTAGLAPVATSEDAASTVIDLFAAFADIEDADNLLTYTLVANSNPGLFSGTPIDNVAGTLTLSYAADASGTADLTLRATDTGGLWVESTFSVTVAPVNDIPTLVTHALSLDAGDTVVLGGAQLQAADAENTPAQLTYVVTSLPSEGTLALDGTALALNDSFTQADIDNGRVSYTHAATSTASDSFSVKVVDTAGAEAPGVLLVSLVAPADPVPEGAAPDYPESKLATESALAAPEPPAKEEDAEATDAAAPESVEMLAPLLAESTGSNRAGPEAATFVAPVARPALAQNTFASPYGGYTLNIGAPVAQPLLVSLNQALNALAGDVRALESLRLSLGSDSFQQQLNQLQEEIRQQLSLDKNTVASSLAISTGLSVGYVLWLVRGGVLLSSLLTSLPAWRLIDPLPILGHLARQKHGDDEDDSLEGMLKKSAAQPKPQPVDGPAA